MRHEAASCRSRVLMVAHGLLDSTTGTWSRARVQHSVYESTKVLANVRKPAANCLSLRSLRAQGTGPKEYDISC